MGRGHRQLAFQAGDTCSTKLRRSEVVLTIREDKQYKPIPARSCLHDTSSSAASVTSKLVRAQSRQHIYRWMNEAIDPTVQTMAQQHVTNEGREGETDQNVARVQKNGKPAAKDTRNPVPQADHLSPRSAIGLHAPKNRSNPLPTQAVTCENSCSSKKPPETEHTSRKPDFTPPTSIPRPRRAPIDAESSPTTRCLLHTGIP